jgi:SAM-dependent methyltransferase
MTAPTEPAAQDNTAQIAYWNDRAAVTWTALQDRLDAMFAPLTAIALAAAAPAPGEHVIDIGCGCGATVLELARRVAPTGPASGQIPPGTVPPGTVLGIDVSEPMTARARQRIDQAGLANAQVLVSDAATHAFAPAAADLLFSRFGVMFFADPAAAFANLRTAIRPGGRLLFACWRPVEENAWFAVPLAAAGHLMPPSPPADPDAPGPFAFADKERVRRILTTAGWTDLLFVRQDVPIRIAGPGGMQEAAEFATRVGALARGLAEAEPEIRTRAAQAIAEALRPFDGPDGITLTGSVWLVSARN